MMDGVSPWVTDDLKMVTGQNHNFGLDREVRLVTVWDGLGRFGKVRDGKVRECHDDERSFTMGH